MPGSSLRHAFLIEAVLVGTAWVVVPLPSDRRAQGKDVIGIPASDPQRFVDILDQVEGRNACSLNSNCKNSTAHMYCGMATYEFEVVGLGASGNQDVDLTKLGIRNA